MKFFLDSAKIDEVHYANTMWNIDGVTSNPRHVRNSGKPFITVIKELAKEFEGTNKHISVEVNPHHTIAEAMVEEGVKLAAMSKNFAIKIPATEAGFQACWQLSQKGIRVNLTLVFSGAQALQAARMGASFVSPFIGWKESNGEEVSHFVNEIVRIYRNYDYKTEIIVAAVRNGRQIVEAAVAGADIVTAGFDVYKDAFDHPYTAKGLKLFSDNWDATPYE
ncbi:MAG: transaldolase [Chloroflexi bacterium]|nr:transaldolase [Chloroflexota bacterium]